MCKLIAVTSQLKFLLMKIETIMTGKTKMGTEHMTAFYFFIFNMMQL